MKNELSTEDRPGKGAPGRKRRPGAGRKPKGDMALPAKLCLYISDEADASLRAWARVEGVERTDIARQMIEAGLREKQML